MKIKDYLEMVAYIGKSDIKNDESNNVYYSKFDNSYITRIGMEETVKCLADREITEELTHGVGFSPKENKWYGWSHRAIYGFEIGSTCKKGDCHYVPSTIEDQEEDAIRFWQDEDHLNVRCEGIKEESGEKFFVIKWEYTDDIPNENLRGTTGGSDAYLGKLGRGEWVAKTMGDAKQMAIDFNEGVS